MKERASGILMPVFSLPGRYGIGCFSREAYDFVDFLEAAGQSYWQILPLGPTSFGDSPYQSFSVYAGNPYFIDLTDLIGRGLLTAEECDGADLGEPDNSVDYGKQYRNRSALLRKAFGRAAALLASKDFRNFRAENAWLADYALFMAIKDSQGGKSFYEWPDTLRFRDERVLDVCREEMKEDILYYEFLQYLFSEQWFRLKKYANEKNIQIIGDIPIYVSADSADVWADPELFQISESGNLEAVSGCPPDGFSADGQLWGNPLYRWEYHRETKYAWWVRRMKRCAELYDVVRIDHFRGFDQYYSIPAGAKTAAGGKWEDGPGIALFQEIRRQIPDIRVIAEDLGYITDSVKKLVRDTGYANMKVLEFAFDSRDSSGSVLYLPYNYPRHCVVYTGTHDNETLVGWLSSIRPEEFRKVQEYTGTETDDRKVLADRLIRTAQGSVAELCVIPIQDYLKLGNEARINTPSTSGNNWKWRIDEDMLTETLAADIRRVTEIYGRLAEDGAERARSETEETEEPEA